MGDFLVKNQRVVLVRDGASFRFPVEQISTGEEFARVAFAALDPDHKAHEEVWVFCVDGRNRVRASVKVAQGGSHGCGVKPCDILRAVIASGCAAFFLVHNHPSGDPNPSHADFLMTKKLLEASRALDLHFLDHLIVAEGGRRASLQDVPGLEWGSE